MPPKRVTQTSSVHKAKPDFKKLRRKVGKKAPLPQNATRTTITSRVIDVPTQNLGSVGELVNSKNATLSDLLSQLVHYSGSVRVQGYQGLQDLFASHPGLFASQVSTVLPRVAEGIVDEEPGVRRAVCSMLQQNLWQLSQGGFAPFLPLLASYITAAMTHVDIRIRSDSMHFLRMIMTIQPLLVLQHATRFLPHFPQLLADRNSSALTSASLVASLASSSSATAVAAAAGALARVLPSTTTKLAKLQRASNSVKKSHVKDMTMAAMPIEVAVGSGEAVEESSSDDDSSNDESDVDVDEQEVEEGDKYGTVVGFANLTQKDKARSALQWQRALNGNNDSAEGLSALNATYQDPEYLAQADAEMTLGFSPHMLLQQCGRTESISTSFGGNEFVSSGNGVSASKWQRSKIMSSSAAAAAAGLLLGSNADESLDKVSSTLVEETGYSTLSRRLGAGSDSLLETLGFTKRRRSEKSPSSSSSSSSSSSATNDGVSHIDMTLCLLDVIFRLGDEHSSVHPIDIFAAELIGQQRLTPDIPELTLSSSLTSTSCLPSTRSGINRVSGSGHVPLANTGAHNSATTSSTSTNPPSFLSSVTTDPLSSLLAYSHASTTEGNSGRGTSAFTSTPTNNSGSGSSSGSPGSTNKNGHVSQADLAYNRALASFAATIQSHSSASSGSSTSSSLLVLSAGNGTENPYPSHPLHHPTPLNPMGMNLPSSSPDHPHSLSSHSLISQPTAHHDSSPPSHIGTHNTRLSLTSSLSPFASLASTGSLQSTLVPVLIECWIELFPQELHPKNISQSSSSIPSSVSSTATSSQSNHTLFAFNKGHKVPRLAPKLLSSRLKALSCIASSLLSLARVDADILSRERSVQEANNILHAQPGPCLSVPNRSENATHSVTSPPSSSTDRLPLEEFLPTVESHVLSCFPVCCSSRHDLGAVCNINIKLAKLMVTFIDSRPGDVTVDDDLHTAGQNEHENARATPVGNNTTDSHRRNGRILEGAQSTSLLGKKRLRLDDEASTTVPDTHENVPTKLKLKSKNNIMLTQGKEQGSDGNHATYGGEGPVMKRRKLDPEMLRRRNWVETWTSRLLSYVHTSFEYHTHIEEKKAEKVKLKEERKHKLLHGLIDIEGRNDNRDGSTLDMASRRTDVIHEGGNYSTHAKGEGDSDIVRVEKEKGVMVSNDDEGISNHKADDDGDDSPDEEEDEGAHDSEQSDDEDGDAMRFITGRKIASQLAAEEYLSGHAPLRDLLHLVYDLINRVNTEQLHWLAHVFTTFFDKCLLPSSPLHPLTPDDLSTSLSSSSLRRRFKQAGSLYKNKTLCIPLIAALLCQVTPSWADSAFMPHRVSSTTLQNSTKGKAQPQPRHFPSASSQSDRIDNTVGNSTSLLPAADSMVDINTQAMIELSQHAQRTALCYGSGVSFWATTIYARESWIPSLLLMLRMVGSRSPALARLITSLFTHLSKDRRLTFMPLISSKGLDHISIAPTNVSTTTPPNSSYYYAYYSCPLSLPILPSTSNLSKQRNTTVQSLDSDMNVYKSMEAMPQLIPIINDTVLQTGRSAMYNAMQRGKGKGPVMTVGVPTQIVPTTSTGALTSSSSSVNRVALMPLWQNGLDIDIHQLSIQACIHSTLVIDTPLMSNGPLSSQRTLLSLTNTSSANATESSLSQNPQSSLSSSSSMTASISTSPRDKLIVHVPGPLLSSLLHHTSLENILNALAYSAILRPQLLSTLAFLVRYNPLAASPFAHARLAIRPPPLTQTSMQAISFQRSSLPKSLRSPSLVHSVLQAFAPAEVVTTSSYPSLTFPAPIPHFLRTKVLELVSALASSLPPQTYLGFLLSVVLASPALTATPSFDPDQPAIYPSTYQEEMIKIVTPLILQRQQEDKVIRGWVEVADAAIQRNKQENKTDALPKPKCDRALAEAGVSIRSQVTHHANLLQVRMPISQFIYPGMQMGDAYTMTTIIHILSNYTIDEKMKAALLPSHAYVPERQSASATNTSNTPNTSSTSQPSSFTSVISERGYALAKLLLPSLHTHLSQFVTGLVTVVSNAFEQLESSTASSDSSKISQQSTLSPTQFAEGYRLSPTQLLRSNVNIVNVGRVLILINHVFEMALDGSEDLSIIDTVSVSPSCSDSPFVLRAIQPSKLEQRRLEGVILPWFLALRQFFSSTVSSTNSTSNTLPEWGGLPSTTNHKQPFSSCSSLLRSSSSPSFAHIPIGYCPHQPNATLSSLRLLARLPSLSRSLISQICAAITSRVETYAARCLSDNPPLPLGAIPANTTTSVTTSSWDPPQSSPIISPSSTSRIEDQVISGVPSTVPLSLLLDLLTTLLSNPSLRHCYVSPSATTINRTNNAQNQSSIVIPGDNMEDTDASASAPTPGDQISTDAVKSTLLAVINKLHHHNNSLLLTNTRPSSAKPTTATTAAVNPTPSINNTDTGADNNDNSTSIITRYMMSITQLHELDAAVRFLYGSTTHPI